MADELSREDINFAKRLGREMAVSNAQAVSAATASSSSTVYRETAIVETVYLSEGTLDVNMGTSDLPLVCYAVPFTTACSGVQVGDTVIIETYGHRMVAVGIVATSSDPAYRPATQESVDKAITGSVTEYAQSQDHETAPVDGWSTEAPSYESGKYIWMRTVTTNGSGDTETTDPVVITGNPGPKGEGVPGTSAYVHLAYANSADGKTDFSVDDPTGRSYLGQYTDSNEDDSTDPTKYAWSLIKGAAGAKGDKGDKGDAGKGISSATVQYASSTSGTTAPTSGWQTSIPTVANGSYLWTKTTTTYTSGDPTTSYSVAYIAKNGTDGAAGTSVTVKSATTTYQAGTSATSIPTGTWQDISKVTVPQGGYLWSKTVVTYSDGTSTTAYGVSYSAKDGSDGAGFAWNLLKGTAASESKAGSGGANQCWYGHSFASGLSLYGGALENSTTYTVSLVVSVSGTASSYGTLKTQYNNKPWDFGGTTVQLAAGKQAYKSTFTTPAAWESTAAATQIQVRLDNVPTSCTVTLSDMKLEKGTTASPWCTTQAETIGSDGASVSAVKIQYYSHTSSTEAPSSTADWQDSVPDWESGKYIWQRTQTTIGDKTVTGDPVLYGAFNSLATSVEGNTSKISQTANALGLTFGTSKATGTLIKADSTGIEVGQSTDGTNYSSMHTKMGTNAFTIHDKSHNELASFSYGNDLWSGTTCFTGYGTGGTEVTHGSGSTSTSGLGVFFANGRGDSTSQYGHAEMTAYVGKYEKAAGVQVTANRYKDGSMTEWGSQLYAGSTQVACNGASNVVYINSAGQVLTLNTRLMNKLNGTPTLLWSGLWNSGSITVDGTGFNIFAAKASGWGDSAIMGVLVGGQMTMQLCDVWDNNSKDYMAMAAVRVKVSGTTWTMVAGNRINYGTGYSYGFNGVTAIYGIG